MKVNVNRINWKVSKVYRFTLELFFIHWKIIYSLKFKKMKHFAGFFFCHWTKQPIFLLQFFCLPTFCSPAGLFTDATLEKSDVCVAQQPEAFRLKTEENIFRLLRWYAYQLHPDGAPSCPMSRGYLEKLVTEHKQQKAEVDMIPSENRVKMGTRVSVTLVWRRGSFCFNGQLNCIFHFPWWITYFSF